MLVAQIKNKWSQILGHIDTLIPHFFRHVSGVNYERERIATPDNDFLDLDWSLVDKKKKLVVISHGFEGSSNRYYVKGMVRSINEEGMNVLAWNMRSCSGSLNKTKGFYHAGFSQDLDTVVRHAIKKGFTHITLVGFSLGGNITLKYLGEQGKNALPQIKNAIAISTPLDLAAVTKHLNKGIMCFYEQFFLAGLLNKTQQKIAIYPELNRPALAKVNSIATYVEMFKDIYGFTCLQDYFQQCSAINYLQNISIPTLIINAQNDPFLPKECYPVAALANHPYIQLHTPARGGHAGFLSFGNGMRNIRTSLVEEQVLCFIGKGKTSINIDMGLRESVFQSILKRWNLVTRIE